MTLGKEVSIAADSTISSSPPQAGDLSPQIKRVTRTYGKRRAEAPADCSWGITCSLENIHKTAPPGLKETIPGSSPQKMPIYSDAFDAIMRNDKLGPHHNASQTEKEGDSHSVPDVPLEHQENASPVYIYPWQKMLHAIDTGDDSESTATFDKPKNTGKAAFLWDTDSGTIQPRTGSPHLFTPRPSVSDDVFNDPLSTLSPTDAPHSPFSFSSPPAHARRSQGLKRRVVPDSDSDEELQKGSSSTVRSSTGHNSFISANPRSWSTPPTSDEEVPHKKPVDSNSRKPESSRVSVPRLDFTKVPGKEGKRDHKGRQTKIRAPTKKDLRETAKERSRLAAQAKVAVPRTETCAKYTVENLLKRVTGQHNESQPSDPIEPFTSPVATACPKESHPEPVLLPFLEKVGRPHLRNDDSEDELPEIRELLQEDAKKRSEELKTIKQRALEQQTAITLQGDECDDLFISTDPKTILKDEDDTRRSKQSKQSMVRKKVAQLAHLHSAAWVKKASVISPSRIQKDFPSVLQEIAVSGSSANLQRIMLAQVQEHSSREIRRKEEEWTKYGGHLVQKLVAPAENFDYAMKAIAGRALEAVRTERSIFMETESDNDNDENDEWEPETQTLLSPPSDEDQDDDLCSQEVMLVDGDVIMVGEEVNADESDSDDLRVHKAKKHVILSDSEEEGIHKPGLGDIFNHSPSSGLATEDEYDKENNTKLIFDEGEDKENRRVVRHSPISQNHGIFDVTDSPEPSPRKFNLDDASLTTRRPFQELLSEGPKTLFAVSSSTQTFISKLQQASPSRDTLAPTPTLKPFLPESSFGFSQFSRAELDPSDAAPLQPSFSELFEFGTEQRSPSLNLLENQFEEPICDEIRDSTKLKSVTTLGLTQDVAAVVHLQPAFQAEASLARKANAIFEKEQAFVIEANTRKVARQHTELYVNELGFLTQTRPLDGTPQVYRRMSPATSAVKSQMETPSQRVPLQTLSLSTPSQFESPRQERLGRLRRMVNTPPRTGVGSIMASPPILPNRQLDAHELLRRGQRALKTKEEMKRKREELGNLFQEEAAESDDDDMFGFVPQKMADDDEDGENLDQNLPGLVDDQKMDPDIEAADRVLDKYKEHIEEDDKKLEELHQAAVQGQLRRKRNRGVGIDDGDDSDEDDNERARRAMKRARKSDRTDIKGLEANEETRAFADSYNQCLRVDDEDDFAFLEKQHDIADVLANQTDSGDEDDNGGSENVAPVESVDSLEIRKALQDRAEEGRLEEDSIDPNDVSWLDQDDAMEDVPRVRSVNTRQGRKSRPDISDFEAVISSRKSPARINHTSKQWFTEELKTRKATTARKNVGLAVTGNRRRDRVASHGPSSSSRPSSAPAKQNKTVASGLSIIADRSSNFA